jgi:hypothetical protein
VAPEIDLSLPRVSDGGLLIVFMKESCALIGKGLPGFVIRCLKEDPPLKRSG